jgi:hypothetical protein
VRNGSSLNFNAGSAISTIGAATTVLIDGVGSSFSKINALSSNQGSLTISGGNVFPSSGVLPTLTNAGVLTVGGANSRLTANSGMNNTGTFSTAAGSQLVGAGTFSTSGTYTVSGSQSYSAGTALNVNGGTATLNTDAGTSALPRLNVNAFGGALTLTSSQHLASLTVSGGQVNLGAPAAAESVLADPIPAAPAAGNKVVVTQALGFSASGRFDIQDNAVIVDYAPAGASPLGLVSIAVNSGFNASGIKWTGNGLISSTAALNSVSYGVGYAEASSVLTYNAITNLGTFFGQTIDKSAVLARFTVLGDATLDGTVDFSDLVKLAQSYNTSGTTWGGGDFTYDGTTDFNDLVKLAQNYNTALPSEAIPGAPADFGADLARAFASVPEPSTLALAAVAACGAATRRRRHRPLESP